MIVSAFLSFVLSAFIFSGNPAKPTAVSEEITWKTTRKLSWTDFKGQADSGDPLHALTASNIDMKAECENGKLKFKVASIFSSRESWTKNRESAYLLYHEQLHFDITEIYARRLRKELSVLQNGCQNPELINKTAERIFAEWKKQEDVYDVETNHGLDKEKMKIWANRIDAELKRLEAFQEG